MLIPSTRVRSTDHVQNYVTIPSHGRSQVSVARRVLGPNIPTPHSRAAQGVALPLQELGVLQPIFLEIYMPICKFYSVLIDQTTLYPTHQNLIGFTLIS